MSVEEDRNLVDYLDRGGSGVANVVIVIATVLLLMSVISSVFIKLDTVVTVLGRISPQGKVKSVRAIDSGEIKEVKVKEGDLVQKGQVLAVLEDQVPRAELEKAVHLVDKLGCDLERIQASLEGRRPRFMSENKELVNSETELWAASEESYKESIHDLQRQVRLHRLSIESTLGEIKKTSDLYKSAKEQEEMVRSAIGVAVSKFKYVEYLENRDRLNNEISILQTKLKTGTEELEIAEAKIKSLQNDRVDSLMKEREGTKVQLQAANADLVKAKRGSAFQVIKSPEKGYLTELRLTHAHQVIRGADEVAKIVPVDAPLVVRAKAESGNVGFISVGAPVEAKVDSFPYQIYGSIAGRVIWLSADAEEEPLAASENKNKQYTLEASLDNWNFSGDLKGRLKPGMSVALDIKTDQRSIASIIFEPLLRSVDVAFRRR